MGPTHGPRGGLRSLRSEQRTHGQGGVGCVCLCGGVDMCVC